MCRCPITGKPKQKFCYDDERCAEYDHMSDRNLNLGKGYNCVNDKYCGFTESLSAQGDYGQLYDYNAQLKCHYPAPDFNQWSNQVYNTNTTPA